MPSTEPASRHAAAALRTDAPDPRFRALAESVAGGVILTDGSARPLWMSAAARDLLGEPTAELAEQVFAYLRDHVLAVVRPREAAGPQVLEPQLAGRKLRLRVTPIEHERQWLVLIDEAALPTQELRREIHDLKSPMNAIALHLELLRRSLGQDDGSDEQRADRAETIRQMHADLARLAGGLDAFCRARAQVEERPAAPESAAAEPFDAREVVRSVAALVRDAARSAGVRVRTRSQRAPVLVAADRERIERALLHAAVGALGSNARGGELGLRVCADRDGRALVLVQDDGPGLPPEHLLGRAFETGVAARARGTGLALAVARSLVEEQGGQLRVTSRPGGGTTVRVLLPASRS